MSLQDQPVTATSGHLSDDDDLLERLAAQAHRSWAGWTDWMLEKLDQTHDSGETFRERWTRQIQTPYRDLPEAEKESDRIEARAYLAIIKKHGRG